MVFWGLEVKPNQSAKVVPQDDYAIHLSQSALGEVANAKATMFVKVDNQKIAIGTLSTEKPTEIQFDLVFEKEFELSHTSKTTSVFFSGYKLYRSNEGDEMVFKSEEDESEDENNKTNQAATSAVSGELEVVDLKKDDGSNPKKDDYNSSVEDDDSDHHIEVTVAASSVQKTGNGEISAAVSGNNTTQAATSTAQITGNKNGAVQVVTLHPQKKCPKSGGLLACKFCKKTFKSDDGLRDHSRAKHGAK